ncbi:10005_t:CDS:2, partial [Ambispora gerdemannii]
RKAMKETDPSKKAALIQAIEEDGLLLQQKYQKKKELSDKFNFDPKKKVDDLIEAMKKAIERSRKKKGGGSGGGNGKNSDDTESSDSDDDSSDDDQNSNGSNPKPKKDPKNDFFQGNKQLIVISKKLEKNITPHYTNLEPYQREIPEPRELTETEKKQIEAMAEQKILKRAEFLRRLQG